MHGSVTKRETSAAPCKLRELRSSVSRKQRDLNWEGITVDLCSDARHLPKGMSTKGQPHFPELSPVGMKQIGLEEQRSHGTDCEERAISVSI